MPTSFLPYEPNQTFLLPPSPSEWLPENHLVYFVGDIIDRLDLQKFYARYEGDGRRNQPYDPAMLVKVLVYGYATGVFSSRKLAIKLYEDVGFRVLGAGNFPSHRTICEFRVKHLVELKELFVAVARLAQELGLVKLGTVALDGTKVKAHASKHKAMSYGRMKEQEQKLKQEIEALLERARVTDAQEDGQGAGEDQGEEQLPEELQRRQERLAKIEAAKARLEERQAQADRERGRHPDDEQRRGHGAGRPFKRPFGVPEDKAQDNFTDPQSRIMKMGTAFEQCYNSQVVVDADSQLIVASGLGNNAADNEHLVLMVEMVKENLGELPKEYWAMPGFALRTPLRNWKSIRRRWRCWWPWGAKEKIKQRLIPRSIRPRCAWPSGWPLPRVECTIDGAKRSWSRCLVGSSMRWAFVNSAYADSIK